MGIIQGRELLNQNPNAPQEVKDILNEFVKLHIIIIHSPDNLVYSGL